MVVDVENDPAAFIVEIASSGVDTYGYYDLGNGENGGKDKDAESKMKEETGKNGNEDDESGNENSVFDCWENSDDEGIDLLEDDEEKDQVRSDLARAADTDKPYVRYKFKCQSRGNDKALWIATFKRVGRLCDESKKKKTFSAAVVNMATSTSNKNSRIRRMSSSIGDGITHAEAVGQDVLAGQLPQKEYRVRPSYAYQHRWMTTNELTDEMNASSAVMHDTRLSPAVAPSREIGILRVEVMQCLGLPRLKGKKSNTVVYLVCGSYAFTTDVITQCQNPMWLKGMKRACALPIYHGCKYTTVLIWFELYGVYIYLPSHLIAPNLHPNPYLSFLPSLQMRYVYTFGVSYRYSSTLMYLLTFNLSFPYPGIDGWCLSR